MPLTIDDMLKMSKILKKDLMSELTPILNSLATKAELNELKDIVLGMRNEMDTEYVIRNKHLNDIDFKLYDLDCRVTKLENSD